MTQSNASPDSPQVLAVAFWAGWCGNCDETLRRLAALQSHRREVAILGVSIDESRRELMSALKKVPPSVPVFWDNGQRLAASFRITQLPSVFLVDNSGKVRAVVESADSLEASLERLVSSSPSPY